MNCSRCSRPIALTDSIECSDGRLSHIDCQRPQVLTPDERALLFVYCSNHAVARCLVCDLSFRMTELACDTFANRSNLCPRCRRDLTSNVRAHLIGCVILPAEIRARAEQAHDASQRLIKQSRQLIGDSDVLLRQAEVVLFERRQALRAAMANRPSPEQPRA